jgi:hypothetical protein
MNTAQRGEAMRVPKWIIALNLVMMGLLAA